MLARSYRYVGEKITVTLSHFSLTYEDATLPCYLSPKTKRLFPVRML